MCRLCEEMSRKVYTIDLAVLIPRKLYRKLSPILLIFAQGNFSFGVVYMTEVSGQTDAPEVRCDLTDTHTHTHTQTQLP